MQELKPCPFCGRKQLVYEEQGAWLLNPRSHREYCIMRQVLSFAMGGGLAFGTKEEVIEAWNIRPSDTPAASGAAATCARCNKTLPLNSFYVNKVTMRRDRYCRECRSEYGREYRAKQKARMANDEG